MASARVMRAWKDQATAYLAVAVENDSADGTAVEYIGSVPLEDLAGKTAAQQKALLVAAVKAVRDAQVASTTDIGISGSVTV